MLVARAMSIDSVGSRSWCGTGHTKSMSSPVVHDRNSLAAGMGHWTSHNENSPNHNQIGS